MYVRVRAGARAVPGADQMPCSHSEINLNGVSVNNSGFSVSSGMHAWMKQ